MNAKTRTAAMLHGRDVAAAVNRIRAALRDRGYVLDGGTWRQQGTDSAVSDEQIVDLLALFGASAAETYIEGIPAAPSAVDQLAGINPETETETEDES